MNVTKIFAVVFLLGSFAFMYTGAQENTMLFLGIHPQSNQFNPAIQYNKSVIIFSPKLDFSVANTSLTYNKIFDVYHDSKGSILYFDFESMEKNLKQKNVLHSDASVASVFVGKKLKNHFYGSFSYSTRGFVNFTFPNTLTDLRYGNANLETNEPRIIDLNNYFINSLAYQEFSFGISKNYYDKLYVGAHVKFLWGLYALETNQFNASITTNDDFSNSVLNTNIRMNLSGPLVNIDNVENKISLNEDFIQKDLVKSFFSLKNPGVAIDLGFTYKFNNQLSFFGAVKDVGTIRWGNKPQQLNSQGEYLFDGFYFSTENIANFNAEEFFNHYADTLFSTFLPTTNSNAFTTRLFSNAFAGATYKYSPNLIFSGMVKSNLMYETVLFEGTAGATWTPIELLSIAGTWSYNNFSLYNFGLGAVVNLKRIQFYVVTDKLNSIDLVNSKAINFAFGMNWRIYPWNLNQ